MSPDDNYVESMRDQESRQDEITELRIRLDGAIREIEGLLAGSEESTPAVERARLNGKLEGLKVARGYVEERERALDYE